jgi:hypothetical protein
MDTREFFDSLDYNQIEDFVKSGREEDLWLDFKTINKDELTKDDRQNFSKALSGFANSDGGVVVWGVLAKQGKEGDVASELVPVENVKKVLTRLNSLTGECVDPSVDGVEHKIIYHNSDRQKGFVISRIPKSERPPHMAKAGIGRYFKRSGDSFYPLEHFDLEDMFGRRPKPRLALHLERVPNSHRAEHVVGITNAGSGIAKFPFIHIEVDRPFIFSQYGIDGNGHTGLPLLATQGLSDQFRTFGGSSDNIVYANSALEVTKIRLPELDARGQSVS